MVSASSRGNDLGRWFMGVLVPISEGEQVEFYLTNGGYSVWCTIASALWSVPSMHLLWCSDCS